MGLSRGRGYSGESCITLSWARLACSPPSRTISNSGHGGPSDRPAEWQNERSLIRHRAPDHCMQLAVLRADRGETSAIKPLQVFRPQGNNASKTSILCRICSFCTSRIATWDLGLANPHRQLQSMDLSTGAPAESRCTWLGWFLHAAYHCMYALGDLHNITWTASNTRSSPLLSVICSHRRIFVHMDTFCIQ